MVAILGGLLSNLLVAGFIACLALVVARFSRNSMMLHLLWLLVLVKLITPPLIQLPVLPNWSIVVSDVVEPIESAEPPESRELESNRSFTESNPIEMTTDGELAHSEWNNEHDELNSDLPAGVAAGQFDLYQLEPGHLMQDGFSESLTPRDFEPEPSIHDESTASLDRENRLRIADDPMAVAFGNENATSIWPVWPQFRPLSLVLFVWLGGSLFWFVRSLLRIGWFYRQLNRATDAPAKYRERTVQLCRTTKLRQTPKVLLMPGAIAPMVWAPFGESFLLLPRDLVEEIDSKKLDALITHEIGHLVLRHHWVRRFELLVTALYWWCPLVWIARHKLREYEEEVCDAWVVQTIPGIEESYAHALVDTVTFLSDSPVGLPPVAVGNNHFHFLNRRITMIMQNDSQSKLSLAGWLVVVAVMLFGMPVSPSAISAASWGDGEALKLGNGSLLQDDDREQDDDEDEVERDDDFDDEGDGDDFDDEDEIDEDDIVGEIIEEVTEGLTELNEEVYEAIDEVRDELQEEIGEAPEEVLAAMAQVDVQDIVDEALEGAPKVVRLFVKEVDPAALIREIVADVDSADVDDEVLEEVQARIRDEFSAHIDELAEDAEEQVAQARRQITEGFREMPENIREQIVEADLPGFIDEMSEDSHPVVKQLIKEVDVRGTLKKAMRSKQRGNKLVRVREEEREPEVKKRVRSRKKRSSRSQRSESDERRDLLERRLNELMEQVEKIQNELERMEDDDR